MAEKMKEINAFINDDYAGLDAGDLEFYYGYEVTYCSEHGYGPSNKCDQYECDDVEWCFTVTKKGKKVYRIPSSRMPVDRNSDPVIYLLAGIGMYLAKSERKKRKSKMRRPKNKNCPKQPDGAPEPTKPLCKKCDKSSPDKKKRKK